MEDVSGLYWWAQCNHEGTNKREAGGSKSDKVIKGWKQRLK